MPASPSAPCPYCQHEHALPVRFTHWGGLIGPRILSLVKCGDCGSQFNGRSGRGVEKAVRVYTCVTLATLILVAAWAIYSFVGPTEQATPHTPARGTVPTLLG